MLRGAVASTGEEGWRFLSGVMEVIRGNELTMELEKVKHKDTMKTY